MNIDSLKKELEDLKDKINKYEKEKGNSEKLIPELDEFYLYKTRAVVKCISKNTDNTCRFLAIYEDGDLHKSITFNEFQSFTHIPEDQVKDKIIELLGYKKPEFTKDDIETLTASHDILLEEDCFNLSLKVVNIIAKIKGLVNEGN